MTSVLQDWVMELPLREQGTLLTCVRGCDLTPKYPLDSAARKIVANLRWSFLNPADEREIDFETGSFFSAIFTPLDQIKPSEFGHLPQHWISHIIHSAEVLGYRHPNPMIGTYWRDFYRKFVRSWHLIPESYDQMIERLGEDRIVTGTVVS